MRKTDLGHLLTKLYNFVKFFIDEAAVRAPLT
jgi:hypothetical protein